MNPQRKVPMSVERSLLTSKLADLWRVDTGTFPTWRKQGLLPDGEQDGSTHRYRYSFSNIDRFHTAHLAFQGAPFPSVAELLAWQERTGTPSLLMTKEVARRLGELSTGTIYARIEGRRRPRLQAVRIGHTWRIAVTTVADAESKARPDGIVPSHLAAKILGLKLPTFDTRIKKDAPLVRAEFVDPHGTVYFTDESVMAYLANHLVNSSPSEWRHMRALYDYEPLLTVAAAHVQARVRLSAILQAMETHSWPVLPTPGGQSRIPQHVVTEWDNERRALPPATVGQVFGVSQEVVADWAHGTTFCTIRHTRTRQMRCVSRECLRVYIAAHRTSPSIDPYQWLARCFQDNDPVITGQSLVAMYPELLTFDDLRTRIDCGELNGVWLPPVKSVPNVALQASEARALARRLRVEERRLWGGDYHYPIDDLRTAE